MCKPNGYINDFIDSFRVMVLRIASSGYRNQKRHLKIQV
jgi:hypothetical protein